MRTMRLCISIAICFITATVIGAAKMNRIETNNFWESAPPEKESKIKIIEPSLTEELQERVVALRGQVEKTDKSELKVNGEKAALDGEGYFRVLLRLAVGKNTFSLELMEKNRVVEQMDIQLTRKKLEGPPQPPTELEMEAAGSPAVPSVEWVAWQESRYAGGGLEGGMMMLEGMGTGETILTLYEDWNMVSVPRVPESFHKDTLFAEADAVYGYDCGSYTDVTYMENGPGYWVCYLDPPTSPFEVVISGTLVKRDSVVTSCSGWVMTGSVTQVVPLSAIQTVPDSSIIPGQIYYYEDDTYKSADSIRPGVGYWVVVTQACTITITGDTIPPVLTVDAPTDSLITNQTSITVSGTVVDTSLGLGVDPTTITLLVNEEEVEVQSDSTFSTQVALVEGPNIITIEAIDAMLNSTVITRSVVLDTLPPVICLVSLPNDVETTDSTIAVIGSVSDSTQITLTINDVPQALSNDGGFNTTIALPYGEDTVTVSATDEAENTSNIQRIITRVSLPPDPAVVAPTLDTTVATLIMDATEFLYTGEDPIQKDVEEGAIDKLHVTVLRGRVLDSDLQPLPGARVTVLGQPELGYTFSREDGMYDVAVNGGTEVRVNFAKLGYLLAQRQVTTRWQTFASVADVILLPMDTTAHRVDLAEPKVVEGVPATDSLGTRKPTIFFDDSTQANLVFRTYDYKVIYGCYSGSLGQGEDTITVPMPTDSLVETKSVTVRTTEYTVGPNAEPSIAAVLPQTIAYTFVVELTADEMLSSGAIDVRFSQPISLYLENLMDFPVGLEVPMGCYNREKGFWETSDNGRVIKIIDTSGGIAAIDLDGDDEAEPVDTLIAGIIVKKCC